MSNKADDFMELVKSGQIDKARAMLEAEKIKAKTEPDSVTMTTGQPPVFKRKGRIVEQDADGNWSPKNKSNSKK